jgi:hypothetical protein
LLRGLLRGLRRRRRTHRRTLFTIDTSQYESNGGRTETRGLERDSDGVR